MIIPKPLLVAALLTGALAAPSWADELVRRDFGWWRVACGGALGAGKCTIGTELTSPHPGERPKLVLPPGLGWVVRDRQAIAAHLQVDAGPEYTTRACTAAGEWTECAFEPDITRTVVAAMRTGRDLRVRVDYPDGVWMTVVPLEGFAAAAASLGTPASPR